MSTLSVATAPPSWELTTVISPSTIFPVRFVAVVAVAFACLSAPARADEAVAHRRYDQGMGLYTLGRYDEAIREFEAGFLEAQRPAFLYNIAQSHRALGRRREAIVFYRRYLELEPQAKDRAEVEAGIATLEAELAKPTPPPATAPLQAPPPTASPPATSPPVALAPPPAEAPPPKVPVYKRWWLWTIVGGVVLVGAGIGAGVGATTYRNAPVPSTILGAKVVEF